MSAKRMCLPGPWRRAMAWPMPPAPVMTRTSSFLLMSDRFGLGVRLSGGALRHKSQGGGAVLGVGDRVDDLRVPAAVLVAVGGVDGVEDPAVGVLDGDVALDAARGDARPVAAAGGTVPALVGAIRAADKELVAGAHDPDRRCAAQLAVAADRRDLKLLGVGDPLKLVVRPGAHRGSWGSSVSGLRPAGRSGRRGRSRAGRGGFRSAPTTGPRRWPAGRLTTRTRSCSRGRRRRAPACAARPRAGWSSR